MVLTIIYLIIVAAITVAVVYNMIKTDKIYEKITGAIMLIVLLLRLFLIK